MPNENQPHNLENQNRRRYFVPKCQKCKKTITEASGEFYQFDDCLENHFYHKSCLKCFKGCNQCYANNKKAKKETKQELVLVNDFGKKNSNNRNSNNNNNRNTKNRNSSTRFPKSKKTDKKNYNHNNNHNNNLNKRLEKIEKEGNDILNQINQFNLTAPQYFFYQKVETTTTILF